MKNGRDLKTKKSQQGGRDFLQKHVCAGGVICVLPPSILPRARIVNIFSAAEVTG